MFLFYLKFTLLFQFIFCIKSNDVCWKGSYGRGVGRPLSECGDGYEKSGALCYPKCQNGFSGLGPICWEDCKSGYDNHGVTCFQNANIYGKGCCCTIFSLECCNNCNPNYKDDGCTCRKDVEIYIKKSYSRTAGQPLICKQEEEQNGALCYSKCNGGYHGKGPVCWWNCKNDYSRDCWAFYCVRNTTDCPKSFFELLATNILPDFLLTSKNECI